VSSSPSPWPRDFLFLASRLSVLGLEATCPRQLGPWPRRLCPRSHLCNMVLFCFLSLNLVSTTPHLKKIRENLKMMTIFLEITLILEKQRRKYANPMKKGGNFSENLFFGEHTTHLETFCIEYPGRFFLPSPPQTFLLSFGHVMMSRL